MTASNHTLFDFLTHTQRFVPHWVSRTIRTTSVSGHIPLAVYLLPSIRPRRHVRRPSSVCVGRADVRYYNIITVQLIDILLYNIIWRYLVSIQTRKHVRNSCRRRRRRRHVLRCFVTVYRTKLMLFNGIGEAYCNLLRLTVFFFFLRNYDVTRIINIRADLAF